MAAPVSFRERSVSFPLHRGRRPYMARSAASNRAEQCPLCPDTSDFDLLSDGKRVIDLNSEVTDRTFHFLVAKQKLDRTQVAGATVDQGRLRAAERVLLKMCGSNPMPATHSATSRPYCRVVMASPTRRRLVNRKWPGTLPVALR